MYVCYIYTKKKKEKKNNIKVQQFTVSTRIIVII